MNFQRFFPLKAIRVKCLDCQAHQYKKVRFCDITECSLWYFRFGRMPQTVIRKEGEASERLFNPGNFQDGGMYAASEEVIPEES